MRLKSIISPIYYSVNLQEDGNASRNDSKGSVEIAVNKAVRR